MIASDHITTVFGLVREVQDQRTGGYICDFTIHPNMERAREGDGFFTVITVEHSEPGGFNIDGEWWFDADGNVMQVL